MKPICAEIYVNSIYIEISGHSSGVKHTLAVILTHKQKKTILNSISIGFAHWR